MRVDVQAGASDKRRPLPVGMLPLSRPFTILAWIALVLGLAFPALYPRATNIGVLVIMAIGLLAMIVQRKNLDIFRQKGIATLLIACAILLVALLPTAKSAQHVLAIFILAPLIFAGCYAFIVSHIADRITPLLIGSLAALGACGGTAIAGYEVIVLGAGRGGFLVNNPIHLADLSVALGFVALVGLYDRSPWRWLVMMGPIAAFAAVYWSGSRGPMLGFGALLIISSAYLVFSLWRGRRIVLWSLGAIIALGLAVAPFVELTLGGREFSVSSFAASLTDSSFSTGPEQQRALMYQGGWGAFLASPLFGHGMVDFTTIASHYVPPQTPMPVYDHLHSDLADFAVIGGVIGLLSYLLILLAPIIGGLRDRGPALYLGVIMSSGYFVMGLTNAMFGVLTQTVLYGVVAALIAVLSRQHSR